MAFKIGGVVNPKSNPKSASILEGEKIVPKISMCGNCLFWQDDGEGQGECRRRSPQVAGRPVITDVSLYDPTPIYETGALGAWPITKASSVCWEWRWSKDAMIERGDLV